jgi:hypothetical protein
MSHLGRQNPKKVAGARLNLKLTRHHVQDSVASRFGIPSVYGHGCNRQLLATIPLAAVERNDW